MQKVLTICFALILAFLMVGCIGNRTASEPEVTTLPEPTNAEYGVLQDLVDTYGFPFELRYTEGMELTNILFYQDFAKWEWHTSNDFTTYENLNWTLAGNTLEITGDWTESFTLDMARGTAVSLTDGTEYRFVVHLPDGIDTKWYVTWDTDVGFTEINGVRFDSAAEYFSNAVDLCQFVKDCLAEPDSFQIHGVSHIEQNGHHCYYLDFSHEIKNEEMERTYYLAEYDGSTRLCIVNEHSAIFYQTEGDYTTKYPVLSAIFQEEGAEPLDAASIFSHLE